MSSFRKLTQSGQSLFGNGSFPRVSSWLTFAVFPSENSSADSPFFEVVHASRSSGFMTISILSWISPYGLIVRLPWSFKVQTTLSIWNYSEIDCSFHGKPMLPRISRKLDNAISSVGLSKFRFGQQVHNQIYRSCSEHLHLFSTDGMEREQGPDS